MIYSVSNPTYFHEPFYQTDVKLYPWEYELLQTRTVRRLKYLSHYGTSSLITSAKHTRFEHTLGVWTLISTFFPNEEELRIAALLHDVGHLPFSHAVERTLGFNHHHITEEYIKGEEISTILHKHGFSPTTIIDLLNRDTPVSHKTEYLSADHLDSFLRDAYMLGKLNMHPADILKNISFTHHYVQTDVQTGQSIMEAIYHDHVCFLHPINLALDALLAKAIPIFTKETDSEVKNIQSLTNNELLHLLTSSPHPDVRGIMSIILWNPEKITYHTEPFVGADIVEVKKIYDKAPLTEGRPLIEICTDSAELLSKVRLLKKSYYFSY